MKGLRNSPRNLLWAPEVMARLDLHMRQTQAKKGSKTRMVSEYAPYCMEVPTMRSPHFPFSFSSLSSSPSGFSQASQTFGFWPKSRLLLPDSK